MSISSGIKSGNLNRKRAINIYHKPNKSSEKVSLEDFSDTKELWALEFPDLLNEEWQVCETYPSLQNYGSAFSKAEDGSYFHNASGLNFTDEVGTDIHALANGNVALNKLDFRVSSKSRIDFD